MYLIVYFFKLLMYNVGTAKLKENVESILHLKTSLSPDIKGAHQVINWTNKHNSIQNIHNDCFKFK